MGRGRGKYILIEEGVEKEVPLIRGVKKMR